MQRGNQGDSCLNVRLDRISGGREGNLSPSSDTSLNFEGLVALYLGDTEVAIEDHRYSHTYLNMPLKRWTKDVGPALDREIVRIASEFSGLIADDFFREGFVGIGGYPRRAPESSECVPTKATR